MSRGPICNVFRRKRIVDGRERRARTYTAEVALAGERPARFNTLATDKRVAEERARERLVELERETAGHIPAQAVREALRAGVESHVAAHVAELRTKGRSAAYAYNVGVMLRRLALECGWRTLRDVSAASFMAWRQRNTAKAPKTLNEYLAVVSGWWAWLRQCGRVEDERFATVGRVETRGRERRRRRALSLEEQERFLAVAGPRLPAYLLALTTGLRRGELAALTWGDVEDCGETAVVLARASTTKNKKTAPFVLRPDVWRVVKAQRRDGDGMNAPVLMDGVPSMAEMREDLRAAGIAEVDESGARVDLHALRKTLITNLGRAGLPGAVVQAYARHSDYRLTTGAYTDPRQLPTASVPDVLPRYRAVAHWCPPSPDEGGGWTDRGTVERDGTGRFVSRPVAGARGLPLAKRADVQSKRRGVSLCGVPSRRVRKTGVLGFEPRLIESESIVLPLHHTPYRWPSSPRRRYRP